MINIDFSHDYEKMPKVIQGTQLLAVFVAKNEELCDEFIDYDTQYWQHVSNKMHDSLVKHNYNIGNGPHLVLILRSDTPEGPQIWTTIRKHTLEKETMYREALGQQVSITITH